MTSLFWVITAVGGIIVFVLAYVSWVKYKNEKRRHDKSSNS
ncbi:sporulation protein YpjB [Virgibacillus phasianinus]|nr:sporulation protein YpjB [Virgibacillus phasianinus]